MTNLVTIDATCEAEGHPTDCTEVVSGTVQETAVASLTINNASGTESAVATTETADMHFDSHAHDHSLEQGCHQNESHDVDPTTTSSSITLNTAAGVSSAVYIVGDAVGTDPTSGGNINITDAGENNSVSESP